MMKGTQQYLEQRHHYGNFWFGSGDQPSDHVVGRAPDRNRPIVHNLTDEASDVAAASRMTNTLQAAATTAFGHGTAADGADADAAARGAGGGGHPLEHPSKKEIILRPRDPPPSYADVAIACGAPSGFAAASPPPSQRRLAAAQMSASSPHFHAAAASQREGNDHHSAHGVPHDPCQTTTTPRASSAGAGGRRHHYSTVATASYAPSSPLSAPYAETIDADPEGGFESADQYDRQGLPRGVNGVDFEEGEARRAQRYRADEKCRLELLKKRLDQAKLRESLDLQLRLKQQQNVESRANEERAVFGYSLPIGTSPHDKIRRRAQREALEREWVRDMEEKKMRDKRDAESLRPPEEPWIGKRLGTDEGKLETARSQDLPHEREEISVEHRKTASSGARQAWLSAWQEHQAHLGAERKAETRRRTLEEEMRLSDNVLSYSDRIQLAEKVRKAQQDEYRDELEKQRRVRDHERQLEEAKLTLRERRYHRPPFSPTVQGNPFR